jgi:hypothetical protein
MKWISSYTYEAKIERKEQWHRWFAWYPVVVGVTNEKRQTKVWLQYVMRKGIHWKNYTLSKDWLFIYKEISSGENTGENNKNEL